MQDSVNMSFSPSLLFMLLYVLCVHVFGDKKKCKTNTSNERQLQTKEIFFVVDHIRWQVKSVVLVQQRHKDTYIIKY